NGKWSRQVVVVPRAVTDGNEFELVPIVRGSMNQCRKRRAANRESRLLDLEFVFHVYWPFSGAYGPVLVLFVVDKYRGSADSRQPVVPRIAAERSEEHTSEL